MMFLQLVAGGHLMLFLTRTQRAFWQPPFPARPLFLAIVITQVVAVLMCGFGLLVPALPWILIAWVWAYNLVWMVFLDTVKLMFYWALETQHRSLWSLFRHYAAPIRPVASRPAASEQPRWAGLGLSVDTLALLLGLLALLAWDFARR
jgi:H+-transporting ATPase